ncbi:hypothetical protein ABFS82_05G138900 [Erythranthe guttata]|uniref:HSF-type DNA-binding domain-containing protein n=1 Tax=Erythranthe guttata TaxID=4155 RepID=A0A022R0J7_ERYGU|nr:hypothetical protein MIMGU_mgv1a012388mg [Erythranthe guttata]
MSKIMQGFRKVDPDRWEFANEGFLGGQKHLLKTIKRRRNVAPSSTTPQCIGGGSTTITELINEEEEIEKLKRDRDTLMAEIMKLKQQQKSSKERMTAMEERIQTTEKKQHQIMSFLAKAFRSPVFVQQYVQKKEEKHIEIGQKRRLTMSPSVESDLQEMINGDDINIESKVESFLLPEEVPFSGDLNDAGLINNNHIDNNIWEDFLSDDFLVGGDEVEEAVLPDEVEVEELVENTPEWGEDLRDLVHQLGFL